MTADQRPERDEVKTAEWIASLIMGRVVRGYEDMRADNAHDVGREIASLIAQAERRAEEAERLAGAVRLAVAPLRQTATCAMSWMKPDEDLGETGHWACASAKSDLQEMIETVRRAALAPAADAGEEGRSDG